jgi:hypothetical protein
MLSDASLYDVSDVFESRGILLHLVVTESDVVGQLGLVAQNLHGCRKLLTRLLIQLILITQSTTYSQLEN